MLFFLRFCTTVIIECAINWIMMIEFIIIIYRCDEEIEVLDVIEKLKIMKICKVCDKWMKSFSMFLLVYNNMLYMFLQSFLVKLILKLFFIINTTNNKLMNCSFLFKLKQKAQTIYNFIKFSIWKYDIAINIPL